MANQDLGLHQKLKKQQMVINWQKSNQVQSEARLHLEFQKELEQHKEAARRREQAMLIQLTALQVGTKPSREVPKIEVWNPG